MPQSLQFSVVEWKLTRYGYGFKGSLGELTEEFYSLAPNRAKDPGF